MRKSYDIEVIEQLERELKETEMVICSHDGSRSFFMFPRDRKTTKSRMFIRIYEIYIDPVAKELVKAPNVENLVKLTFMHQIFVTLRFDYRENKGMIDVPNFQIRRLVKHHPFMSKYLGVEYEERKPLEEGSTVIHQHTDTTPRTAADYGV